MTEITQQRQNERATLPFPAGAESGPLVTAVGSGEPTSCSIKPPEIEATEPTKTTELQWKFAEETHQYVREYIRQADLKAAFFFAGATALIAFLYKANLVQRWVKPPTQWLFVDTLSFVATVGLAVSVLACLATVFPRLKGSKRGHVFFGAISEFESRKEYATDVLQRDIAELIDAKLCHAHDLAIVCGQKYWVLRFGQWAGATGVVAMVALLLLAT
jgi:Family of unknown function (DUF5706)